jgi:hypothetical protein
VVVVTVNVFNGDVFFIYEYVDDDYVLDLYKYLGHGHANVEVVIFMQVEE